MKLAFTGAGGGHFYPLIAVVEKVRALVFVHKINTPDLYFLSDKAYDERALYDNGMRFIQIPAGKLNVFPTPQNILNLFKTSWGILVAIKELYRIYPDVIFAKGGYASFPTIVAAKLLSIPLIIHESDSVAGRTTKFASKFAVRVAISQKEAVLFFKNKNIALTGLPIRAKLLPPENFTRGYPQGRRPAILVFGGSQGSVRINETLLGILPEMLQSYDIVHQAGEKNIDEVKKITDVLLKDHPFKDRYFVDGFIDPSLFYPKVDLVVTRAGSTTLFETALWGLPQVVIPIPETISRDQRSNAYAFLEKGTCTVIEENNLTPHLLLSEITRVVSDKALYEKMSQAGKFFDYSRTASDTIAEEMIRIAMAHYE